MTYQYIKKARFLYRPNRFIAHCELEGKEVVSHVRNTGRCRELLIPGVTVYLEASMDQKRKTGYSLITVEKGNRLVNMDSTAPNRVMKEALESGQCHLPGLGKLTLVKPEARYTDSRFDFYLEAGEQKAYVEVKGVTLEEEGVALFPDAPTERGIRHMEELIKARNEGFGAYLVFIVQMKGVSFFSPHIRMHPQFGAVLKKAHEHGVHILCYDCEVTEDSLTFGDPVPVVLD